MHGGEGAGRPSPVSGPAAGAIRISPDAGLHLQSGQTVSLTVIKQLAPGKWAVAIGGRVYPAFSRLALEPGAVLSARVSSTAGRFVLTLTAERADPLAATLHGQGLPTDETTVAIVRALAASGLPIRAETIDRMRTALSRLKMPDRRAARLAAALIGKGIDPSGPAADALLALLGLGDKGGGDARRYRRRPLPENGPAVRAAVEKAAVEGADRPSALQLFNHVKGKGQTWVVIPFVFDGAKDPIAGTIKIQYDPFFSKPLRLAVTANGMSFFLPLEGPSRRLSIFCDEPRMMRAAERGLDSLRAKFHNMGMEVDDTILGGEVFDGFSPASEGDELSSVDVVG